MAINPTLNRDPFAQGGVMDEPDQAVRVAMNKIAMGLAGQLTPQEHRRLANRQRLEEQSSAVAAQKSGFQSLIGQAPIDVRSYKGSMWAGANPQEDRANAALEARFGKRVPGQIDISYGGQQATPPQYTPAYAPATSLLGQAQESQYDARVSKQPGAPATGLGGFGAGATAPLASTFNPSVFSTTPTQSTPKAPSAGPLTPKYVSGFEQAANVAPMPLGEFLARGKLDQVAPAKNLSLRANEAIADVMRSSFQGITNPLNPTNWTKSGDYSVYTPEAKQLADLQGRYEALEDKSSPTAVSLQKQITKATTGSTVPITSLAGNLIKLPGAIGGQQQTAQPGYQSSSGPLAIDGYSSAGASNPPLSQSVPANGTPYSASEQAQIQTPQASESNLQREGFEAPLAAPALTPAEQQSMNVEAQGPDVTAPSERPTRIYAFGNNASVEPSPIQQAKGERVKPLFETSFDKALAASPSGRAASVAEARFLNTLDQQQKKALKTNQDEYLKNVGNALALNPSLDISKLPKLDQNAARVMAAEIKKKTGLDEKQNSDAFSASLKEAETIPVGDEKVSTIMSSFVKNGGNVTPEFVKQVQDLYKAPVDVTKSQGYTIVRAGNTYRVLDDKMKPFDVNRADKQTFSKLLNDSVIKYGSWESLPNEEKFALADLNDLHPQPVNTLTGEIPSAKEIWEKRRALMATNKAPAPVAGPAQSAYKPSGAKAPAKASPGNLPPGWGVK